MQYSIVRYGEVFSVESDSRMDSEFYKPNFIKSYRKLKSKPFAFIGSADFYVTDGEHGSPDWDINSGIKYITAENIEKNLIKETDFANISKSQNTRNNRSVLKETDVLLYSVGAYCGNATKMERHLLPANIPRSVAIIRTKSKIFNPSYISTFLNTEYGTFQTERLKAGNAQPMLALEQIKKIVIPNLLEDFQLKISDICNNSYRLRMEAKSLYQQAENLLLEELCLKDWKPKHQLSYVKNYSDTQKAERFDAEYFQPQYEEVESSLRNYSLGHSFIKDEFRHIKDVFKTNPEKTYQYVEIGSVNISNGEIIPEIVLGSELPANAKRKLKTNQIIISKVRTYRGAVSIVGNSEYVGSGAFTTLEEKPEAKLNKETLLVLLKSKPLLAWSLKPNTGTSYPVIIDSDILNLPLPLISKNIQAQIKSNIEKSNLIRIQSKSLLEIAKKAVEMAIESNEEKATKWIDQELEKLGVQFK